MYAYTIFLNHLGCRHYTLFPLNFSVQYVFPKTRTLSYNISHIDMIQYYFLTPSPYSIIPIMSLISTIFLD